MRKLFAAFVISMTALSAHATTFSIDAMLNSISGGTGAATLSLASGEAFTVSVDPSMLWSSGSSTPWSNADGHIGDTYATGTDASGASAGAVIGTPDYFSAYGMSFAVGSLVGELNGNYFVVGSSYAGVAAQSGILNLFYWDGDAANNSGVVVAAVNAVPEPATCALLLAGLGLIAAQSRRRRQG